MEILKAKIEHLTTIMNIVKNSIIHMESKGIYQWDNIYPNEEVIDNDIDEENLYVYFDENIIKGIIVLNEHEDKAYESVNWKYNLGSHFVIHRLCVEPNYQGKGIARMLVQFAENYGKKNGYESIRLDAFVQNEGACKLYEKSGYDKVGIVTFRKGEFYCFEKGL